MTITNKGAKEGCKNAECVVADRLITDYNLVV